MASVRAVVGGIRCLRPSFSWTNSRSLTVLARNNLVRVSENDLSSNSQLRLRERLANPCFTKLSLKDTNNDFAGVLSTRTFAEDRDDPRVVGFHEFKEALGAQEFFVIDVREPKELVEDGKLLGAVNIPLGQIDAELALSPNQLKSKYHRFIVNPEGNNMVFFCKAGIRAEKAVNMAHKHGYKRARFYKGSFLDWVEKGGSVVKG